MTALEVSADAIHAAECVAYRHEGRNAQCERSARAVLAALKAAGFVVATRDEIRAMSVDEQAELIGGEVEGRPSRLTVSDGRVAERRARGVRVRAVGPWREVQP